MSFKDNKSFELIKAIKKTNNQVLKLENDIVRKYGLTAPQYGVLECLYIKGDMHINELIDRLISTSGTMTIIIKNLEKSNLVEKKSDLDDKRFFKVCLTEKGRGLVEEIFPLKKVHLDDFVNTLTVEEQDNLLKILYKFKERYKK